MDIQVDFFRWQVPDLKEYLQHRGITCHLYRKQTARPLYNTLSTIANGQTTLKHVIHYCQRPDFPYYNLTTQLREGTNYRYMYNNTLSITTNFVSSNPAHGEVHNIMW
jgi:hypothetical protein